MTEIYFLKFNFSAAARNKQYLRMMGITHVLNTAEGSRFGQVDTGHSYYRDMTNLRWVDRVEVDWRHLNSSLDGAPKLLNSP